MLNVIKHTKLNGDVIKQSVECNKYEPGMGSRSVGCKMENLKELNNALGLKKQDAEDMMESARKNQKKVQAHMADLEKKQQLERAREKKEEAAFQKEVDAAVESRMRELRGCEATKIESEMRMKKDCNKASSDAMRRQAQMRAMDARKEAMEAKEAMICASNDKPQGSAKPAPGAAAKPAAAAAAKTPAAAAAAAKADAKASVKAAAAEKVAAKTEAKAAAKK